MAIVPFPRARRRLSIRYYLCTEDPPVRIPLRLYRDMAAGQTRVPRFAETVQRIAEVIIAVGPDGRTVKARTTAAHFDKEGFLDLSEAVEAVAIAIEGSRPRNVGRNVIDLGPTLRLRKVTRTTRWQLTPSMANAIRNDIDGKIKLPAFRSRS